MAAGSLETEITRPPLLVSLAGLTKVNTAGPIVMQISTESVNAMTLLQEMTYKCWNQINTSCEIIEPPIVMSNETFGEVVYFTAKYDATFMEYGIKPNGDLFVVR